MSADLKDVASDLTSFLETVKAPKKTPALPTQKGPSPDAAKVAETPEPTVEDVTARHRQLVRAVFDYVTARLVESDGARTIGESYMLAVAALARDSNESIEALNNAAISFLEDIIEVAREGL